MVEEEGIPMRDSIPMRVSNNFWKLMKELKEIERERGNRKCSDPTSTEIFYQRIRNMGGLKKFLFKTTALTL